MFMRAAREEKMVTAGWSVYCDLVDRPCDDLSRKCGMQGYGESLLCSGSNSGTALGAFELRDDRCRCDECVYVDVAILQKVKLQV